MSLSPQGRKSVPDCPEQPEDGLLQVRVAPVPPSRGAASRPVPVLGSSTPGDTGETSPGPLELSSTPETSWLFKIKPCRQGSSSSIPQQQLPKEPSRGVKAGAAGPLLTPEHWGNSLQLHYSPPSEKVTQNNLGIACLIGLQPSSSTHSQGSMALLKRWISRASVWLWELGAAPAGHMPSLPRAVPLPASVTALRQPCCHSLHGLSPSSPSWHTTAGTLPWTALSRLAPSPQNLTLSPVFGTISEGGCTSLGAALQEPPGAGDKNCHRIPSPSFLLLVWLMCVESTGCKQPLTPGRILGLKNNSRNSQTSSFQAVKNQNNGPQVERAPAPSPNLLCTCSPSTNTQLSPHHRAG